ncbi:MAG: efflux RND transporter periplasmic adaptor subunit [Candidatus Ancaeobacter aquaticus]|nr:efflux RND transporter periplasmic adaptor subunit [Candidatus Ancaeobacter aquaticus]
MKILKIFVIIIFSFAIGGAVTYQYLSQEKGGHELHDEHGHEDEHGEHKGISDEQSLDEKVQKLIGVKIGKAVRRKIRNEVSVIGHIAQDTEFIYNIVPEGSGEIITCNAEIGSFVNKGDVVCTIKKKGPDGKMMEVKAPVSGVVVGDFSSPGDKVDKISSVHAIADLSKLWAILNVYEKDIAQIKLGQKVIAQSIAYPEKTFDGEILFISPRVDENTRTIKVRALVKNPEYLLKLGMFITADIIIESDDTYLTVPKSAVFSFANKKIVFVKTAQNKFETRDIEIIDETKNEVAIGKGISENEAVVVDGGFLLKSEALRSQLGSGCAE